MKHHKYHHLRPTSNSATNMIIPPPYMRSNSFNNNPLPNAPHQMIVSGNHLSSNDHQSTKLTVPQKAKGVGGISFLINSLISIIATPSFTIIPTACRWLTSSVISSASSVLCVISRPHPISSSKVTTVTLFGHRNGHAFLAIQEHPRSEPLLILDLPMSTSALVKQMSSGLARIALECDKKKPALASPVKKKRVNGDQLLAELEWTMYCNSRKCGTARATENSRDFASFVLSTVGGISVGAGVIPVISANNDCKLGELMYMRARFERVLGNHNSEAFYMMNPDSNAGGPELSIFLLRL